MTFTMLTTPPLKLIHSVLVWYSLFAHYNNRPCERSPRLLKKEKTLTKEKRPILQNVLNLKILEFLVSITARTFSS